MVMMILCLIRNYRSFMIRKHRACSGWESAPNLAAVVVLILSVPVRYVISLLNLVQFVLTHHLRSTSTLGYAAQLAQGCKCYILSAGKDIHCGSYLARDGGSRRLTAISRDGISWRNCMKPCPLVV